jgi:hypothetical protein
MKLTSALGSGLCDPAEAEKENSYGIEPVSWDEDAIKQIPGYACSPL